MKSARFKPVWMLALLFWLALIASGQFWLIRYSFARGPTASAPNSIPASLNCPSALSRPQLFLSLHPRCPCSRATLNELAKILTRAPNASDVTVLLYKPANEPDTWLNGTLKDECQRMGCKIRVDADGRLASSLGSLASGSVVLYGAEGRLRYHGGITIARGHAGDNAGERGVLEILQGLRSKQESMPVFGCPLQSECTAISRL